VPHGIFAPRARVGFVRLAAPVTREGLDAPDLADRTERGGRRRAFGEQQAPIRALAERGELA